MKTNICVTKNCYKDPSIKRPWSHKTCDWSKVQKSKVMFKVVGALGPLGLCQRCSKFL